MTQRLPSIRRNLLAGLIGGAMLVWSIIGIITYLESVHEIGEVFDANLSQEARVLVALLHHEAGEKAATRSKLLLLLDELGSDAVHSSSVLRELVGEYVEETSDGGDRENQLELPVAQAGHPYEFKIAFRAFAHDDTLSLSHGAPVFPSTEPGYSDQSIDGISWRVYTLRDDATGLTVQVGEEATIRDELTAAMLMAILWPALISLPLLALLVWHMVGRGLRPLQQLATLIRQRDPDSLEAVDIAERRFEIQPMVVSLNRLFARVRSVLDNERRFTSNAAHELRTPLAALRVHAQSLQLRVQGDAPESHSVQAIIDGADRTGRLLDQLLTLARADSEQARQRLRGELDLQRLAVDQIADIGHLALEKDIDIAFVASGTPRKLQGDAAAMAVLLRNLLDNAIRYTPPGGQVEVRVDYSSDQATLSVCDDGPGIPEAQRELLFERFQRGSATKEKGSGLGLSIVRQIAELHAGRVQMATGIGGKGLCIGLQLPLPD